MNILGLFSEFPPFHKSLETPNAANAVRTHLESMGSVTTALFGLPDVFITGSSVWRPALGIPQSPEADLDVMLIGNEDEARSRRAGIVGLLALTPTYDTGPSMPDDRDKATLAGIKYLAPDGRTVDIWGMADVHTALQQYPEHSHASSRMAWDCQHGCLVMYPNTAAVSASLLRDPRTDELPAAECSPLSHLLDDIS